jgi:hypothetical protein
MKIDKLECSVFDFQASEHVNEMKFSGTLVLLDEPSTKAPNGSQGKKIFIPKEVAKKALHTLIGQGVNYKPELDGHAPRRKVGVIQKAWIDGNKLKISGVVWKKDFPEAEQDLKKSGLGMSFEASEIGVENATAAVWKLTSLCFTGATILYRKDAAYANTHAIAAQAAKDAADQIKKINGGNSSMAHSDKKKKKVAASASKASTDKGGELESVLASMTSALKEQTSAFRGFAASNQELRAEMIASRAHTEDESESGSIEAEAESASQEESSEEERHHTVRAAKKKKKESESDSESDSKESESESDSGEMAGSGKKVKKVKASAEEDTLEEMGESDSEDAEPGHLNEKAKQKGDKTTVSTDGDDNKTVSSSAFRKLERTVGKLIANREDDQKTIKRLKKKLSAQAEQIEAAAENTERRSVSVLTTNLLAKGGVDVESLQASGAKLPVDEMDAIFAKAAPDLNTTQRIAVKTELVRAGVLDEGIVSHS